MLDVAQATRLAVMDTELEYRWFGPPSSLSPVVLLHEGLGSLSMWKDFPERLARRTGRRVLAYSRTGYGASSPLRGKREPGYMHHEAEAVLPALLSALSIDRPVLLGHSDGGSIALIHAGRFPDKARALVLEAPHVFVEPVTVQSIAAARTTYETTDLAAKLGRYHRDVDGAFWGWNDIWLDPRFLAWNIEDSLPRIACPILVLQGAQDEYGTAAQLDAIAAQAPGPAEVVLLDGCGHSPHRDQPERTLAAIADFLNPLG